jgi:hypothetical protein
MIAEFCRELEIPLLRTLRTYVRSSGGNGLRLRRKGSGGGGFDRRQKRAAKKCGRMSQRPA